MRGGNQLDRKEPDSAAEPSRREMLKRLGIAGLALPALSAGGGAKETPAPRPIDMGLVIERGDSNYESWRTQLAWHGTA